MAVRRSRRSCGESSPRNRRRREPLGRGVRLPGPAVRPDPDARDQRDRRPPAHEPRARAARRRSARGGPNRRRPGTPPSSTTAPPGRGGDGRTTSALSPETSSAAATRSPSTTTRRPLMLALAALARGRAVLVSRGELVAIGGSFKIPEILEASGARLARGRHDEPHDDRRLPPRVHARGRADPDRAPLELRDPRIHGDARLRPSSRRSPGTRGSPGFTTRGRDASCRSTSSASRASRRLPSASPADADLVTFSGDKLLSRPAGRAPRRKRGPRRARGRAPVARAVRPDKLTLAALAATLRGWKTGAWTTFPVYRAAAAPADELERAARRFSTQAGSAALGRDRRLRGDVRRRHQSREAVRVARPRGLGPRPHGRRDRRTTARGRSTRRRARRARPRAARPALDPAGGGSDSRTGSGISRARRFGGRGRGAHERDAIIAECVLAP